MAPQCTSRRCWCSPWPLLGHQVEVSWAEPAVEGHHDAGQPAPDGGSILQEPSKVLLHQRPHGAFLHVGGLAVEAASTGRRTGSCCCSCCRSAISVGEARWSGPLELPQCRTAPLHCPQCLPTAPLHCLPVPPDSSATLSPGRSWLFYFQSCSQAPAFVGEWGWGVEGKQVGSMDEEPQVRGCYNITFICTPTNQETV